MLVTLGQKEQFSLREQTSTLWSFSQGMLPRQSELMIMWRSIFYSPEHRDSLRDLLAGKIKRQI